MNRIVIIGAGNIATHLAMNLKIAGFEIAQIIARTEASAKPLAEAVSAKYTCDLKNLDTTATYFMIAVSDDEIANVAKQIRVGEKLVIHTSGSTPMDVLKDCSTNYGVLYPFQTFSKKKVLNMRKVPICVEGSSLEAQKNIVFLSRQLSDSVQVMNFEQRAVLHLAGVFACNFTNYMYAIANDILAENNLSFDLLKPLITETVDKVQSLSPREVQTGPAIRKDMKTIERQEKMLEKQPDLLEIYKLLTKNIM